MSKERGAGLVRSPTYVGADRRTGRKSFFNRKRRRLDDLVTDSPDDLAHAESLERMMRRLRVHYDVAAFDPVQRAEMVVSLEAAAIRGEEMGEVWPPWARAIANYVHAVGAFGELDAKLIMDAINAISAAHSTGGEEKPPMELLIRLEQARLPK